MDDENTQNRIDTMKDKNLASRKVEITCYPFPHVMQVSILCSKLRFIDQAHRVRAETAYWQPCPSCSRQHFISECILPLFCLIFGKTETKYIHLKMLSATGRTRLPVRSFWPPPV